MIVQKIIITGPDVKRICFVVCSSCPNEGPTSNDEHLANIAAIMAGWNARHVIIGDAIMTLYTCPDCLGGN